MSDPEERKFDAEGWCGGCGQQDDIAYLECCGMWYCEDCADRHDEELAP